jgi:hypothetical protein
MVSEAAKKELESAHVHTSALIEQVAATQQHAIVDSIASQFMHFKLSS